MLLKEWTKIEFQRDISQIGLQAVFCRLFAGILQVVYRLFAIRDIYISSCSMLFPIIFRGSKKKRETDSCTNEQSDGQTDGPPYRDAWMHLTSVISEVDLPSSTLQIHLVHTHLKTPQKPRTK